MNLSVDFHLMNLSCVYAPPADLYYGEDLGRILSKIDAAQQHKFFLARYQTKGLARANAIVLSAGKFVPLIKAALIEVRKSVVGGQT